MLIHDVDTAHRHGHMFLKNGTWHCTSHGRTLIRRGANLECPTCGFTVLSPLQVPGARPEVA